MAEAATRVRDFDRGDQDAVRALILAGLREHWGELDETLNPDLDDIGSTYGHGRTLVGCTDGHIVATGSIVPRDAATAEILRISVHASRRRSGLGRAIVDELMATARRWGAAVVVLETSSDWRETVAFYRSCRFVITHHEQGPYCQNTWFRRAVDA